MAFPVSKLAVLAVSGLIPTSPIVLSTVFFAIMAAAMAWPGHRWMRRAALLTLMYCIVVAGLTGQFTWPFFNWHLYAYRATPTLVNNEVRVADVRGRELKYDARAVRPSIAARVRRFARAMPEMPPWQAQRLGAFFLEKAVEYRGQVERGDAGFMQWIKFPPHQMGFRWTDDRLRPMGQLHALRVYRIEARMSRDGRAVLDKSETLVGEYR